MTILKPCRCSPNQRSSTSDPTSANAKINSSKLIHTLIIPLPSFRTHPSSSIPQNQLGLFIPLTGSYAGCMKASDGRLARTLAKASSAFGNSQPTWSRQSFEYGTVMFVCLESSATICSAI